MLQVRQRLGDFEIIRLLGKGGMGEVYEAQQLNPPRRVALKVLAPWLAEDEEALQRFWREAVVPAQLDHPGIVRIITTDQTPDGIAYYTMQLVRGVTLAQLIQRANAPPDPSTIAKQTFSQALPSEETPTNAGPVSPVVSLPLEGSQPAVVQEYLENRYSVVIRVGIQAARALAAAHRLGVLHRDIKPSNLMVDHHNQLYVVDFGLTRALFADGMVSAAGAVRGTPWYMSPEQARGDVVDGRSDIYSLGVTLYELTSLGLGPYTANRQNSEAILTQVKTCQALPLRVLAADVPPALERVIGRAMHFNPRRRYQSAAELAEDLEKLGVKLTGVPKLLRPRPRLSARFLASGVLKWAAGVLVAVAAVAGIYLRFFSGPSANDGGKQPSALSGHEPRSDAPKNILGVDRNPLPRLRRHRAFREAIPLLCQDPWEPIWWERVAGTGGYISHRFQLEVHAKPADSATMLALDTDPDRRWFELSVELDQVSFRPDDNQLGIFFGWQDPSRNDTRSRRFFVVRIDDRPVRTAKYGAITMGTAYINRGSGTAGEATDWFRLLPEGRGFCPLAKRNNANRWHLVCLRVQHDRINVHVDGAKQIEFGMAWLKKADPETRGMDPRGAVGLWARQGFGWFRNATIVALPAEN